MTAEFAIESIDTDILILGAGGAGLCAALHAADRSPNLSVTIVVKGLLGRAGCTRMVQGGYNAVLTPPDSIGRLDRRGPSRRGDGRAEHPRHGQARPRLRLRPGA